MTTKDRLLAHLNKGIANGVLPARKGDNLGPVLGSVYYWQETVNYAKEQLDTAWSVVVEVDAIESDQDLRKTLPGTEWTAARSKDFSVTVRVDKPRQIFSRDKFIEAVARKYKLDRVHLHAIAQTCVSDSAPPLHKKVLEA